jgi:hypothetical protein
MLSPLSCDEPVFNAIKAAFLNRLGNVLYVERQINIPQERAAADWTFAVFVLIVFEKHLFLDFAGQSRKSFIPESLGKLPPRPESGD